MNSICGIDIDFPTIEGCTERQEWYANSLREVYIANNEARFREIAEIAKDDADYRTCHDGAVTHSFYEEFTEPERACLFGTDAGGIIATLKKALNR